jgi:hypothetical protein
VEDAWREDPVLKGPAMLRERLGAKDAVVAKVVDGLFGDGGGIHGSASLVVGVRKWTV